LAWMLRRMTSYFGERVKIIIHLFKILCTGRGLGAETRARHCVDAGHEACVLGIVLVPLEQELAGLLVEGRLGVWYDQEAFDGLRTMNEHLFFSAVFRTKRMCLMPISFFQSFLSVLTQISPVLDTLGWKILVTKNPGKNSIFTIDVLFLFCTLWRRVWKVVVEDELDLELSALVRRARWSGDEGLDVRDVVVVGQDLDVLQRLGLDVHHLLGHSLEHHGRDVFHRH